MSQLLDPHAALIATMVLVAAADEGTISDAEIETMTRLVANLPAFAAFDRARIGEIGRGCAELLAREDGLEIALARIAQALPAPLRETAYALACDVAAADQEASQDELRLLALLRERFELDPLVAAAIERAARARHRRV
ncbi:MAG: tellurite resistance TerB family protein [Geminicoccaceae bacterium]|nr:tellurite resistance TerB family protein [Geminicoccaceae bacterium]MCS7267867.1 tellurite resistance TerB family protein [Geminicoccaceae bacterium]MCX7629996.1 tellurite resistance TerB family protein [Geminicoccaceae bacterium]MDW8124510.1 tellurite resistance TerB family protein [Geminicoccaceae bacterium]MDW8341362.1 tellurite resistance TerB family protein [Geminicoccaceae bacterium]